jgi:hypothetical protein
VVYIFACVTVHISSFQNLYNLLCVLFFAILLCLSNLLSGLGIWVKQTGRDGDQGLGEDLSGCVKSLCSHMDCTVYGVPSSDSVPVRGPLWELRVVFKKLLDGISWCPSVPLRNILWTFPSTRAAPLLFPFLKIHYL